MRPAVLLAVLLGPAPQDDPALPRCPKGWKVEVVARFPAVRHCTAVCAAPDGRVFVGEDPQDMEGPVDAAIGRVRCVHPDGRITLFAEGLGAVFGLQYLDGKLYVHHVPKLTVFRDEDGVGKDPVDLIPATHPEPWRGNRYNTHIPSGFRLALDGYFYMAVGDKGLPRAVGRDGSTVQLRGGGVLRFRPDGTGLEVFATGTRTFMDVAVGPEDDLFAWDNDDNAKWGTRLLHLVEGGYYGYPWDRGKPWSLGQLHEGRGVPAGALFWAEDGLPAEYADTLFLCEWGRSQIVRMKLARDGAGWKLVSREPFVTRGREEFRPVGIAASPDGRGFYVGDWNTAKRLTKGEGGRVLRFSYAAAAPAARPPWWVAAASGKPFEASTAELVEALGHPAREVRLVAQRRLADRRAWDALKEKAADAKAPALARIHALWALPDGQGGRIAAKDPDPVVRRQALRQLALHDPKASVGLFAMDASDPRVRFAAALGHARAGVPAAGLADEDPLVRYMCALAHRRAAAWKEAAWALQHDGPAAAAVFHATYSEDAVRALAGAVDGRENFGRGRALAVELLAELHRRDPPWDGGWWGTRPALNPKPRGTVEWKGTRLITNALRRALEDRDPDVVDGAVQAVRAIDDRESAKQLRALYAANARNALLRHSILDTLAAWEDPAVPEMAASALGDPALAARASQIVKDPEILVAAATRERSPDVLVPLLEALGRHRAGGELLGRLARHDRPSVRRAAVGALGRSRAVAPLLEALGDPDLAVRRAAVAALAEARSQDAVPALVRAAEEAALRADAIEALAGTPSLKALDLYLEGLGGRSPRLRTACRSAVSEVGLQALPRIEERLDALPAVALAELQEIFKSGAPQSRLLRKEARRPTPLELAEYALAKAGDPARGKAVYEDLACARCHAIDGRGGDIGPEISLVGALYDRAYHVESVLYPSKIVAGGYRQTLVRTKGGEVFIGLPRGETPDELVLLDAEERRHVVRKTEIEARRVSEVSIMPEGLVAGLSPEEFADLMAFLGSLKAGE